MIGILVTILWGGCVGNSGRALGKIGSPGLGSYDSFVIVYNFPTYIASAVIIPSRKVFARLS